MTTKEEQKPFYEDEEELEHDQQEALNKQDKRSGWDKTRQENNNSSDASDDKDASEQQPKVDVLTLFIEAVKADIQELFVDRHNTPFAATKINEHLEVIQVKSRRFARWISKSYYDMTSKPIKSETLNQIVDLFESEALFSEHVKDLQLRTSSDPDNKDNKNQTFCYDLTNKRWQIVKITQKDWSIEESINLPIMFTRFSNQLPQVLPTKRYQDDILDQFMNLINVKDENNKLLLKCYLISLFIPDIPKPVLMLHGEQGSAKTTCQDLLKKTVDPSSIVSLTFPRDINELVQQLSHNYIAFYDNVSFIKEWISDQVCRAVTGSGFSKRQLFKDDDDIIYNFKRCIGFNGINLAASKADLLDRGIIVQLERISKDKRVKVKDIFAKFEEMKPQLLGYIFDILVKVIRVMNKGGINLDLKSRMADFEECAEVISRCIGYNDGEFIKAYYANQQLQTQVVLEGSPVAVAIVKLMQGRKEWVGTATELLTELDLVTLDLKINTQSRSWPKSAHVLSRRLNEIRTNLREIGILIDHFKNETGNARIIQICKIASEASEASETVDHEGIKRETSDATNNTSDASLQIASDNSVQNDVQNESSDASDSSDGIIRNLKDYAEFSKGNWYCKHCNAKGDKWLMQDHKCSGKKKEYKK